MENELTVLKDFRLKGPRKCQRGEGESFLKTTPAYIIVEFKKYKDKDKILNTGKKSRCHTKEEESE